MKASMKKIISDADPAVLDRVTTHDRLTAQDEALPPDVSADRIRAKVFRDTGLTPPERKDAIITKSPASAVDPSSGNRKKNRKKWLLWAVSAACFLLIGAMVFGVLRSSFPAFEDESNTGTDDPLAVPQSLSAPWTDGRLSFVTMSYKDKETTAASVSDAFIVEHPVLDNLSFRMGEEQTGDGVLTEKPQTGDQTGAPTETGTDTTSASLPGIESTSPDEVIDPSGYHYENCAVSLISGTKITDCAGGRLIRVKLGAGEHADCDGVYYDAEKDEAVCMSCLIKSMVKDSDAYLEACVRSVIDDGLLTVADMGAGDSLGTDYYLALTENGKVALSETKAGKLFLKEKRLTVRNLGLTDLIPREDKQNTINEQLAQFVYPKICMLEYGTDMNKCAFLICSAAENNRFSGAGYRQTYGVFIADLASGDVTRVDGIDTGKTIGKGDLYGWTNYSNKSEHMLACIADFSGVSVNEDYTAIAVTLPWTATHITFGPHGWGFSDPDVVVFDTVNGGFTLLRDEDSNIGLLLSPAVTEHGVTYYEGVDHRWYFFSGDVRCACEGNFVRLCRTEDGELLIVMDQNGDYVFCTLDGTGVQAYALNERLDEYNRFAVVGNERVDLLTGEHQTLWEDTPLVMTATNDHRFLYLYFAGQDSILCIDTAKNETGRIPLSDDFVMQATGAQNEQAHFLLFTNRTGDRLLLTYYKDGTLTFDREGYLADKPRIRGSNDGKGIIHDLDGNLSGALDYLRIDGEPVHIRNKNNMLALAKLVCPDILSGDFNPTVRHEKYAALVEVMLPYMDYSGRSVEVSRETLNILLNGLPIGEIDNQFLKFMPRSDYSEYFGTKKRVEEDIKALQHRYADDILYYITGYIPDDCISTIESTYDWEVFRQTVQANNDPERMAQMREDIRQFLADHWLPMEMTSRQDTSGKVIWHLRFDKYALKDYVTSLIPACVEAVTDMTYGEFLSSGHYLQYVYGEKMVTGRTDVTMNDVRWGRDHMVNRNALGDLLNSLTFTEEDVSIRACAVLDFHIQHGTGLYGEILCSLSVGYDADGNAWAVSGGWSAPMTREQAEAFASFCSEGDVLAFIQTPMAVFARS